jgi:hypothetical protein
VQVLRYKLSWVNTLASCSARKDLILPLRKPIIGNDGTEVREIMVPNGTHVTVSLLGANRNRDIWGQDAYEWKPERWMSPLPDSVTEAHFPGVYSNMSVSNGSPSFLTSDLCIRMTFSEDGLACEYFSPSQLTVL